MKNKCSGQLRIAYGDCDRPATVNVNGRWYCWQHDPARAKEKADRNFQELKRREAELEAQWNRSDLERNAGIRNLTDDDLRKIIAAGGIAKILANTNKKNPKK